MEIQAEKPQPPGPTCPIYLLASDSKLNMLRIFQSIKVLPQKSPDLSLQSGHLLYLGPWFVTTSRKVMLNPTRKLTHTHYLGNRGQLAASETRSGIKIAGFEATGSYFGLNLHTAVACQRPCFWQWVPAEGRKQYSDGINTSASNYRDMLTLILKKDHMYDKEDVSILQHSTPNACGTIKTFLKIKFYLNSKFKCLKLSLYYQGSLSHIEQVCR